MTHPQRILSQLSCKPYQEHAGPAPAFSPCYNVEHPHRSPCHCLQPSRPQLRCLAPVVDDLAASRMSHHVQPCLVLVHLSDVPHPTRHHFVHGTPQRLYCSVLHHLNRHLTRPLLEQCLLLSRHALHLHHVCLHPFPHDHFCGQDRHPRRPRHLPCHHVLRSP